MTSHNAAPGVFKPHTALLKAPGGAADQSLHMEAHKLQRGSHFAGRALCKAQAKGGPACAHPWQDEAGQGHPPDSKPLSLIESTREGEITELSRRVEYLVDKRHIMSKRKTPAHTGGGGISGTLHAFIPIAESLVAHQIQLSKKRLSLDCSHT